MHIAFIVGARPNFVKVAPLLRPFDDYQGVTSTLIHTGQHYDPNLSDVFFHELRVRRPDIHLEVGSGSHAQQTARILEGLDEVLGKADHPNIAFDRLVVVGDVNSTMAATLVAAKREIPVAHIEAGLRSFDRSMPEEINRIVTDSLADMLFVSEPSGVINLQREGHPTDRIHLVGNVMIDTLLKMLDAARAQDTLARYDLKAQQYGVVTLHRPSNVDHPEVLRSLVNVLTETSHHLQLVFPVHPRTMENLRRFDLLDQIESAQRIICLPPVGYLDFLALSSQAKVIVTDSGGLQEESTALGIPCLTLRENTERPITVEQGTSTLIGNDATKLKSMFADVLEGRYKIGECPSLWDGQASQRIAEILVGNHSTQA